MTEEKKRRQMTPAQIQALQAGRERLKERRAQAGAPGESPTSSVPAGAPEPPKRTRVVKPPSPPPPPEPEDEEEEDEEDDDDDEDDEDEEGEEEEEQEKAVVGPTAQLSFQSQPGVEEIMQDDDEREGEPVFDEEARRINQATEQALTRKRAGQKNVSVDGPPFIKYNSIAEMYLPLVQDGARLYIERTKPDGAVLETLPLSAAPTYDDMMDLVCRKHWNGSSMSFKWIIYTHGHTMRGSGTFTKSLDPQVRQRWLDIEQGRVPIKREEDKPSAQQVPAMNGYPYFPNGQQQPQMQQPQMQQMQPQMPYQAPAPQYQQPFQPQQQVPQPGPQMQPQQQMPYQAPAPQYQPGAPQYQQQPFQPQHPSQAPGAQAPTYESSFGQPPVRPALQNEPEPRRREQEQEYQAPRPGRTEQSPEMRRAPPVEREDEFAPPPPPPRHRRPPPPFGTVPRYDDEDEERQRAVASSSDESEQDETPSDMAYIRDYLGRLEQRLGGMGKEAMRMVEERRAAPTDPYGMSAPSVQPAVPPPYAPPAQPVGGPAYSPPGQPVPPPYTPPVAPATPAPVPGAPQFYYPPPWMMNPPPDSANDRRLSEIGRDLSFLAAQVQGLHKVLNTSQARAAAPVAPPRAPDPPPAPAPPPGAPFAGQFAGYAPPGYPPGYGYMQPPAPVAAPAPPPAPAPAAPPSQSASLATSVQNLQAQVNEIMGAVKVMNEFNQQMGQMSGPQGRPDPAPARYAPPPTPYALAPAQAPAPMRQAAPSVPYGLSAARPPAAPVMAPRPNPVAPAPRPVPVPAPPPTPNRLATVANLGVAALGAAAQFAPERRSLATAANLAQAAVSAVGGGPSAPAPQPPPAAPPEQTAAIVPSAPAAPPEDKPPFKIVEAGPWRVAIGPDGHTMDWATHLMLNLDNIRDAVSAGAQAFREGQQSADARRIVEAREQQMFAEIERLKHEVVRARQENETPPPWAMVPPELHFGLTPGQYAPEAMGNHGRYGQMGPQWAFPPGYQGQEPQQAPNRARAEQAQPDQAAPWAGGPPSPAAPPAPPAAPAPAAPPPAPVVQPPAPVVQPPVQRRSMQSAMLFRGTTPE